MHVHFTHIKKRVTAALGNLLPDKAVSCTVSVVKADHIQCGATTNCVQGEISISVATNGPF